MYGQHAACREDAGAVINVCIQLRCLGIACHSGHGDGTIRCHEALKSSIRHRKNRNQGTGFHLVLCRLGGADKYINLTVCETLLLVGTAVIGHHLHLAALLGHQGAEGQVTVRQGISAAHLHTSALGLLQNALQTLIRCGVNDPGTVIDGADGIHLAAVEVHFLGAVLLAEVMTVVDAVAEYQEILGARILIGEIGCCREAVTAGHVLHDEVVLALLLIGYLCVLPGYDVCGTADAVGADDLDGLAAVAALLCCRSVTARCCGICCRAGITLLYAAGYCASAEGCCRKRRCQCHGNQFLHKYYLSFFTGCAG